MGSASNAYADAAKRLAGRSVLAIGSGIAAGSRLVAKGVSALTTDSSDREAVCFLKFAQLEWGGSDGSGDASPTSASGACTTERLPVLLIGLASGFQVWRLDGASPAELVSRRDKPARLLEAIPEPRASSCTAGGCQDCLQGDRPLLAVVPARDEPALPSAAVGGSGGDAAVQQQYAQQYSVLLYSLRSQGYVRTLGFSGEVLGVQASSRLLVVSLRGQLQAFDALTLQHTFSCLTYTPPPPPLLAGPAGSSGSGRNRLQQPQHFVTDGLASSGGSSNDAQQQQGGTAAGPGHTATAASSPFALGPRWLAYAADTPVPAAGSQPVAQRLPLARRDSSGGRGSSATAAAAALDADSQQQLGSGGPSSAAAPQLANGLTKAAVADAALQAAAKGGQQLKAGLTAVGTASFKYLSLQYQTWRQGQPQQRDVDAQEADAAVAGTVVVRDVASRLVVAHFRAHTSPLAALLFSQAGTLLATASVAGHSINLFRIVPPCPAAIGPAAAGGGGDMAAGDGGGTAGYAVHLYRLYRGVTPAAIRDIAIAPDEGWVAASSGRGTTHLFHTPAAAPGGKQPEAQQHQLSSQDQQQAPAAASATGVVGLPPKTLAAGRARKPGLLSGGVAGAATSAARNLYAGQATDAAPIAAAFLAPGPRSSEAALGPDSGRCGGGGLLVVTHDGVLTRHLLSPPASQDAASASGSDPAAPSDARSGLAAGLDQAEPAPGDAAAAAAAVLEEVERWDVARHASWPEREELLPGAHTALPAGEHAAMHSEPPAAGQPPPSGGDAAAVSAEQQQRWVAQAEAGALAEPGAMLKTPLWQDTQFRFYELQLQACLQQPQPPAAAQPYSSDGSGDVTAAQRPLGGVTEWLETIPVRPVQQQ
ncbi:hypothetical protein D9Q98_008377 [Chlorella vulgaris]|uniref:BCAS3 domain-containing protein n=1 Tax=Chlorella vulgaris TaxID=3077 RepID=A0A9D4TGL1_CHLVU|nr:hypothetical protein D9Q98_008377 [Chlorella vulgaris]